MYQQTLQPELPSAPQPPVIEAEPRGLDLFDVMLIFARRKWLLLGCTLLGALSLFLWTLTKPKLFEADATIMPPQEQQSSSALMGQLSMLTGFGGGGKSPSDLYVSLLISRTIRLKVATDFHLDKVYRLPKVKDAEGLLGERTKVAAGKDGLITIKVRDVDAKRAAAMANDYGNALYALNSTLAIGQASQRRLFFDQQLSQEKDRLADAEVALKQVEEKTGVIQLSGQTSVLIGQVAQLRANITSHAVQLASLRSSSTEENPEVIRVRSELAGLQEQLHALEGRSGSKDSGDLGLPSSKVPEVGLEYIRKERDVQYHQTLFELLARQLEAARIDEAKAAPIVQVLDPAEPPPVTTYPKTKLFTIVGAVLGLVVGLVLCVLLYLYDYVDEDPQLHTKMWAVKAALLGRSR